MRSVLSSFSSLSTCAESVSSISEILGRVEVCILFKLVFFPTTTRLLDWVGGGDLGPFNFLEEGVSPVESPPFDHKIVDFY